MKPKARLAPMHETIFELIRAQKLSYSEAERRSGAPHGFLCKAWNGEREGPQSENTWAMLVKMFGLASIPAVPGPVPAAGAPLSSMPAVPGEPGAPQAPSELVLAIRDADSLEKLDGLTKLVLEGVALPMTDPRHLGPNVGNSLRALIYERRQILGAIVEEQRRVDARKPVEVRIVWTSDWREKVAANEAADAADAALVGGEEP